MPIISLFMQLFKVASTTDTGLATDYGKPVARLKMDRALLCLDCESIFEAEGPQKCPSCGSAVAWAIGRALNREAPGQGGSDDEG